MKHLKFLLEQLFQSNTKYGKLPPSEEEFDGMISNLEYEKVLKGLMIAENIITVEEEDSSTIGNLK